MITGIIQASGFSRRMKRDKLLIEIDNMPVVEKVIKAAVESKLDEIILIYRNPELKEIAKKYKIKYIENQKAELGQSEGLKLGVKYSNNPEAYMFFVGDQPFLTSDYINLIIDRYNETKSPIIIPYCNGKKAMPMIMAAKFREELLQVQGDKGGRDVVNKHLEKVDKLIIDDPKLCFDIDTPEDLALILKTNKN